MKLSFLPCIVFALMAYPVISQNMNDNPGFLPTGDDSNINCRNDCQETDFPSDWHYLGPYEMEKQNLGKVHALWTNPADENHILAGAESGLWKTTDSGANWTCLTDYCLGGAGVACIAVQPDNPDIIYLGSGVSNDVKSTKHEYGYGLFKSTDGGQSWNKLHVDPSLKPQQNYCSKILIHPVFFSNIYALTGSRVYKSVDYGESWTLIFGDIENPDKMMLKDIEINPSVSSHDEVYISCKTRVVDWDSDRDATFGPCTYYLAGTIKFPTARVWKFDSGINTGTMVPGSLKDLCSEVPGYANDTRIAMLFFTPNSLNIACQTESGKIMIFRKKGENEWTGSIPGTTRGYNSVYSFPFAVSPANDDILYLGGYVLYKSVDGGEKFSSLWPYWAWLNNPEYIGSHADIRDFILYRADPEGNDMIFMGTDGGIGKTGDGGKSTTNLNGKGLQLTQFFGISNSEKYPWLIYGGCQDNGIYNNSWGEWRCDVIGDAYDAVSDPDDSLVAYTTTASTVKKTTSGGGRWISLGCPPGENCMDRPLWLDNQKRLYVGAKNLWRRDEDKWTRITDIETGHSIRAFELTEDGNTAYLAYSGELYDLETPACRFTNRIFKVTDINTEPEVTDITACLEGIRWTSITGLAIEPLHGEKLWVTFGGFWESRYKVFRFERGEWTEYGQGLPDMPANAIKYIKGPNDLLFLGMDDGVYYRNDDMGRWEPFRCNLPHTIITDLEVNYSLNVIRAATYGRGIWESPIPRNRH